MSDWKECTIKDIASDDKYALSTGPFGSAISSQYFKIEGVPVIRGGNLSPDVGKRLNDDGLVFIDQEKAKEFKRSVARRGDLIFTCWGTINQIGLIDKSSKYSEYIVSNKQMKLTPDLEKADSEFLYYLFSGPDKQSEILNNGIGAAVPGFNLGQLKSHVVQLPPLPEQKAIASILSSLDDKIDLLNRQNKTLEAIAETLFRQWFIEEAQEDWEEGKLGDLVDFNYGKTLREQERIGNDYPVIGSNGIVGFHKDFLVEAPGIVTGRKGTLGVINYLFDNFFPIDTTFYVTSKIESQGLFYEYFLLKSVGLGDMNSDSAVPGLNRNAAHAIPVIIPPNQLIGSFNEHCKPTFSKIKTNQQQIRTLENLRDTLLPKLMSGEVRVAS
jgi:type I restriction enzyme S subunit